MNGKRYKIILISILLTVASGSLGYYVGRRGFEIEYKRNPIKVAVINKRSKAALSNSSQVDFSQFWEVWDLLNSRYLERPLDGKKLLYGSLKGLVESVGDPYTSFLTPKESESFSTALNGEYEGIGAELGMDDDGVIMVVSPLEGSPAKASGLKARDRILKIDGENAVGLSLAEAVSKIRGPSGATVTLSVSREGNGKDAFDIRIVRNKITLRSVTWEDEGDGIAYIKIATFGEKTNAEWDETVSEIRRVYPNLKSVILDVRNNPGGFLSGAVYISSEFIKKGPVVYQEYSDGSKRSLDVMKKGMFTNLPVAVLINGGSASASEIIAGALRDRRGAELIGDKSFGKGTIQDAQDFSDGSSIHITIAKWLTPKKIWVHKVGLTPDVEVSDDPKTENDEQLEKAIEVVKNM